MMSHEDAKLFCELWLPAWSGNQPEKLASFYTPDAFYSDPGLPDGIKGRDALLAYLKKLLRHNAAWTWEHLEAFPMEGGFLNKWCARIPAENRVVECVGVCTVQFDDDGLIRRNEVYFDRTEWMTALSSHRNEPAQPLARTRSPSMLDKSFMASFAQEWIASWNSHDLNRILSHYEDDFEMSSPVILQVADEPSGRLKGKDLIGAYWAKALRLHPGLSFELVTALLGVESITLYYRGPRGMAAEVFHFDSGSKKVARAFAHYA